MDESKIREAIDACRPHHDDLALTEMRELAETFESNPALKQQYDRSRRLDSLVSQAMRETPPVPRGLAERLLAKAREQQVPPGDASTLDAVVGECVATAGDVPGDIAAPAVRFTPHSSSRRSWIWSVINLTSAAGLITMIGLGVNWLRSPPPLTRDGLSAQALTWVAALPNEWQTLEKAPAKAFPPGLVLAAAPLAWQPVAIQSGDQAVVYDVKRGRGRAFLFVVRTNASSPFSTSPTRLPSSGGWGMGAWKVGGTLYVLVVDESRQRLEEFVRQPRTVAQSNSSRSPLT